MSLQGSKITVALVALSAFVPNLCLMDEAFAQATANDTMNISAKVVNPLAVTPSLSLKLNFQSFAVKGAGSYVLMPGGTSSVASGVTIGGATAGTAVIKVPQSVSFTLSIPTYKTTSIFMTAAGGGASSKVLTVKSIFFAGKSGIVNMTGTLNKGNNDITAIKVTDTDDSGKIGAGAKIIFGPNQVVGTYKGSFVVRITL